VCCSVLQCVSVCCSVLQCVAVCCSMLQCVAVCDEWHNVTMYVRNARYIVLSFIYGVRDISIHMDTVLQISVWCSVVQCGAV